MTAPFLDIPAPRRRLSDQVKESLKQAIMGGALRPGDKLPPEQEMADRLKVSKVTAREALRDLEAEGLIEKHRGVHGGTFVTRPRSQKMGEAVINYYHFGGLDPEELCEFRRILEPSLVLLAAERRTEEDLAAIRRNIAEVEAAIERGEQDQPGAIAFHRLLADACHNRLISAVMEALTTIFLEILSKIPMTLEDAKGDLAYNRRFYDCLVDRDGKSAQEWMVKHFETLSKIIERTRIP